MVAGAWGLALLYAYAGRFQGFSSNKMSLEQTAVLLTAMVLYVNYKTYRPFFSGFLMATTLCATAASPWGLVALAVQAGMITC